MRQFARRPSSANGAVPPAGQPPTDAVIQDRINRSMRRRMSDDLVSLIRRACLCGHAEAAKGLWVVLHDLIKRETANGLPPGGRPGKATMRALAIEIEAAAQQGNPVRNANERGRPGGAPGDAAVSRAG